MASGGWVGGSAGGSWRTTCRRSRKRGRRGKQVKEQTGERPDPRKEWSPAGTEPGQSQGFREWLCRNCFPQHEVRFSSQRVVLVEDQVDLTLAPLLDHHRMLQEVPPHGGETQRPIAPR